jgi:basic membrane protein A and related proteins
VGVALDHGGRGDQDVNDLAAVGVRRSVLAHDVRVQEATLSSEVPDREIVLRLLAESGNRLVVSVGWGYDRAAAAVAADYPDHTFAVLGGEADGDGVASVRFADEEGAFLVGAAAALTSESGRVGILIDRDDARGRRHQAGYAAGARHVRPDVVVDVSVLDDAPVATGVTDAAVVREIAVLQYQAGADVVYEASGVGMIIGVLEAVRRLEDDGRQHWAIASGTDQYDLVSDVAKTRLLTTMRHQYDRALEEAVTSYVEDGGPEGTTVLGLAAGGVGYTLSGGHLDAVNDQLQVLRRAIIAGDIEVPTEP